MYENVAIVAIGKNVPVEESEKQEARVARNFVNREVPITRIDFPVEHDRADVTVQLDENLRLEAAVRRVSQSRGLADELLEENLLDMREPHFEIPRFTSIGGRRIRRRSRTLTRGARDMEKVIKQFTAGQPKTGSSFHPAPCVEPRGRQILSQISD